MMLLLLLLLLLLPIRCKALHRATCCEHDVDEGDLLLEDGGGVQGACGALG